MARDSDADTGGGVDTAMANMAINEQSQTDPKVDKKRERSSSPNNARPAKRANLGGDNGDVEAAGLGGDESGAASEPVVKLSAVRDDPDYRKVGRDTEMRDADDNGNSSLAQPENTQTRGAQTSALNTSEAGTTHSTGIVINDDEDDSLFVPEDRDTQVNNPADADGNETNGIDDDDDEYHVKTESVSDDDGLADLPQIQQTPAKKKQKKANHITQEGRDQWDAMYPALRARVLEGMTQHQALTTLSRYKGRFILMDVALRKGEKPKKKPEQEVRWLCLDTRKTPQGCRTHVKADSRGPGSHEHKCHKGKEDQPEQTAYGINQRDPKSAVKKCLHNGRDDCKSNGSKGWDNFHGYHKHLEKSHYRDFDQQPPTEGQTKLELQRRAKLRDNGPNANWADWTPEPGSKKDDGADFDWSLSRQYGMAWAVGKGGRMIKRLIEMDRKTRQNGQKDKEYTPEMEKAITAASKGFIDDILCKEEEINNEALRLIADISVPDAMVDDSIAEPEADAEGDGMNLDDKEADEGDDEL
ncbi:hypothetical protein KJ359_000524 [Pestalotiopsis sp. 9143b]|nr:hypothetical protein KJ359_000524 [Pestalotiopsis sp. 9143b]